MLLAAGLGTRLRPLTERRPKALVEVRGVPMLERVARRVIAAGAGQLIINTHHLAEQIERYVDERDGWGVNVRISREPNRPLDTGGGLLYARCHFRRNGPFFVHNTDILTDFDLRAMYDAHVARRHALATLSVMERPTSRYLLFDEHGLFGRVDERQNLEIRVRRPVGRVRRLAFGGVHVISPAIFALLTERGVFSILEPYLRLAADGYSVLPFRIDGARWLDIGSLDQLERAEREFSTS